MDLLIIILSVCPATLAERQDFTVCYDTSNRRPLWTAHRPIPSIAPATRRHWRRDRELNSPSAKAFTNAGFDITGAIYNSCGNEKIEAHCYVYTIAYLPDGQLLVHFAPNAETLHR